jgi:hypothetical protein
MLSRGNIGRIYHQVQESVRIAGRGVHCADNGGLGRGMVKVGEERGSSARLTRPKLGTLSGLFFKAWVY